MALELGLMFLETCTPSYLAMKGKNAKAEVPLQQETLSAEVQTFASQLGLAQPDQSGFHDLDFRPDKAGKRTSTHTRTDTGFSPKKPPLGYTQEQQRMHSSRHASPSNRSLTQQERDHQEKVAAVRGRSWKAGTGVRPGEKQGRTLLGRDESTVWHEALEALPDLGASKAAGVVDEWTLERFRNEGEAAVEKEAAKFEQDLSKNRADFRWLQQVRQYGTTADKLAAMTLLIQESAVANLKSLDELLRWVGKRSGARAAAAQAIEALKELFSSILLPERRLLFFEQQPLTALPDGKDGKRRLLYYYVEDAIKKRYIQFVKELQEASRDNLDFMKEKAIKAINDLLRSKPEQEAFLLTALVDKLGDPSRKLASNAGYLLGQLLEQHPAMQMVVAQEVERFILRPHIPARAVYYGVVFLNQMVLSRRTEEGGSAVAKKLIGIFFTLFQLILDGKLGHACELRAAREEQANVKPTQKSKKRHEPRKSQRTTGKRASDRPGAQLPEAAEVDAKMLAALLTGVRRAFPFVDAADTETLMAQHSTALFRVMHTATFGVAVQALSLLFQLLDAKSATSDRFYRALYGLLLAPDVARSNKSAMFLSLLYKALRADVSSKRIIAFIKRLLQVAMEQQSNFACGCLLLISELLKERSSLWGPILEPEEAGGNVERFEDQPDDDDSNKDGMLSQGAGLVAGTKDEKSQIYDMSKREPLHCKAEQTCIWELVPLAGHVHPSVAAMARALLAGVPVEYAGDPMRDLSTTAFLDKLVQKKPKAQAKGASLMQPAAKAYSAATITPAFAALSAADVAPDTAYFHKFYEVKAQREAAGLRPKGKRRRRPVDGEILFDDEDSLADSDAASEEIDNFMEGVEDSEDEAAPGDYSQLEAAMRADTVSVLGEEEEPDPEDVSVEESSNSEADALPDPNGSGWGSGNEEDQPASEPDDADTEGESAGDSSSPEDIDPFQLASASGEDSDSQTSAGDSDPDGEWVMAQNAEEVVSTAGELNANEPETGGWVIAAGAADLLGEKLHDRQQDSNSAKLHPKRARRPKSSGQPSRKKSKQEKGTAVFASADDYAKLLDEDEMKQVEPRKGRRNST